MSTVATLIAAASIDIDITALFMAGLFLLLLFILQPLIIAPYLRARDAREAGVEGARAEASKHVDSAESMMLQWEEQMRVARREAAEIRDSLRNQGVAEQRDILEEARTEINGKLNEERARLQTQIDEAQKQIETRAKALSEAMVEKILPTTVN